MKEKLLILFFLFVSFCKGQDSTKNKSKWSIGGYIKNIEIQTFDNNLKNLTSSNLLHNRLNFKWKPSSYFTLIAEFRNRFYWGEEIKLTPDFAEMLRNDNEKLNLQKIWVKNSSLVLHSNTERLYVDYSKNSYYVRVGRQRINWGITTTWNPNDIFNAYNFLDFDYEERAGVDGGKIQYIFNGWSNAEIAYAFTNNKENNVAAIKYALNKWEYDFQLITGWYKQKATIGFGWAGSIKDAGFKGELQYYFKNKDASDNLNFSVETDYMFKNSWYVNASMLYRIDGLAKPLADWGEINFKISPENLMPTKWSVILKASKEFNPLFSANINIVYAPGTQLLIVFPTIVYNLAANLDVNLVWQSFFTKTNQNFKAMNHRAFLRLKWSF